MLELAELEATFIQVKDRKALCLDGINSELLKYGRIYLTFRLLYLYNIFWLACYIPENWKTANVLSAFKKGSQSEPNN